MRMDRDRYDAEGRLRYVRDVVYETPASIFTVTAASNRVVTNGRFLQKPLEVIHTGGRRGLGVWCS